MHWDDVTIIRNPSVEKKSLPKPSHNNLYKIENKIDQGELTLNLVPHNMSQNIIRNRQKLNLTQKELAAKINENVKIITEYENGKTRIDGRIVDKLNKFFKTNIRN